MDKQMIIGEWRCFANSEKRELMISEYDVNYFGPTEMLGFSNDFVEQGTKLVHEDYGYFIEKVKLDSLDFGNIHEGWVHTFKRVITV